MALVDAKLNLPRNLYIEVTNRCNLKCRTCILYRGSWEPRRDMTFENVVGIAEQLPELERVALHGIGEPLLNDALPGIIRYLKDRKSFVLFNSNGILLDEAQQDELIDAGLDELRISLDAASASLYRTMRDSDQFDRIVSNLRSFVKRMQRQRVSLPALSLWFLGTRENIAELPAFVRLAADIGVTQVYLQRLVYFQDGDGYGLARSAETLVASDEKIRRWLEQGQKVAGELDVRFNASGLTTPLESIKEKHQPNSWKGCIRPTTLMYITANGNVLPCCISPFSTTNYTAINLGNAFENTLEEIWLGSKYRAFRKSHHSSTPPKSCLGCGNLWSL